MKRLGPGNNNFQARLWIYRLKSVYLLFIEQLFYKTGGNRDSILKFTKTKNSPYAANCDNFALINILSLH